MLLDEFNKREIIILDCYEIRCPKVLLFVFIELCDAFKFYGYTVKIINSIDELHNNSIVFMGDTFYNECPGKILNMIAPEAIYIGWYWQEQDTSMLKYFIYTYENMLNIYYNVNRIKCFTFLKSVKNNVPLLLRANDNPEMIGKYEKNKIYDYCYIGWQYCPELVPSDKFNGIYHGVLNHNEFLKYEDRKNIYLSSIFALGFQSNDNIGFKHVSQRIFEGMAYGCIVLTNSMPACEQTDNIAIYIDSKNDLENKMIYYLQNPDEIKKKQLEGYEFVKKYGTNHLSIQQFINKINILYKL